jgi:RNA polymerase sigma-70 factor (ECF subfamily)
MASRIREVPFVACSGEPSSAGGAWNEARPETLKEVDATERQVSMNAEALRARFESEILPLMPEAYNLAWWLMKNPQDAEDVVQEAYLRAFRYFHGYHGGSGKAWLFKIVRNVCFNFFANRVPEGNVMAMDNSHLEVEDSEPLPSVVFERKATIDAVRAAVETLPADYRTVIVLREMEGLSYKEIAEVTGVPIGTVMSRLARARQSLTILLVEKKERDQL